MAMVSGENPFMTEIEKAELTERIQYLNADLDKFNNDWLAKQTITTTAGTSDETMYVQPKDFSDQFVRGGRIGDAIGVTPTEKQGWGGINPYDNELWEKKKESYSKTKEIDILKELLRKEEDNTARAVAQINPFDLIKMQIAALPKVTNAESQKRALALLLLEKLMKLLGI